jgi:hypothetical protein
MEGTCEVVLENKGTPPHNNPQETGTKMHVTELIRDLYLKFYKLKEQFELARAAPVS